MTLKHLTAVALTVISAAGVAGCGSTSEADDRGASVIGVCRGHGGVVALEDEIVICRDQTAQEAPTD